MYHTGNTWLHTYDLAEVEQKKKAQEALCFFCVNRQLDL